MIVLALRAQDVGADPGAQRLRHGNRTRAALWIADVSIRVLVVIVVVV